MTYSAHTVPNARGNSITLSKSLDPLVMGTMYLEIPTCKQNDHREQIPIFALLA